MASTQLPRYRYREEAPEVISVPAAELVARLPEELRGELGEGVSAERRIDLPCSEILLGNVPRITLGRLVQIVPDLVRLSEGRDPADRINLPPAWIALYFRMVTHREELPPEPVLKTASIHPDTVVIDAAEPSKDIAPKEAASLVEVEPMPSADDQPPKMSASKASEMIAIISEEPKEEAAALAKEQSAAPKKGFFSSLPIFRRAEVSDKETAPRSAAPVEPAKPSKDEPVASAGTELVPSAPLLERLWKLDPQDELADGSALQALFMTDEKLTLEKVVSKAGELPGLDACVLAHGDRVICASKAPEGTDLKTLSGQAMTMLSQIRDSSEKMGLGAVPAVTLHADRGVVSFLHRGELCLLVLHADRGFVPGVRERLQEMLGHLSEARPALPPASGS